jgi:hypothetical protein
MLADAIVQLLVLAERQRRIEAPRIAQRLPLIHTALNRFGVLRHL